MDVRNRLMALAVAAALASGAGDLAAQTGTITGRVTTESGAGVASAQVVITNQQTGNQSGALSQADGQYLVAGLRAGTPYLVDVRMIGYGRQAVEDVTLEDGQTLTLNFTLTEEAIALDALEIFATRAQERTTPVAFSNVGKVQIQNQLGSRDLPLVLNVTPSVYSTQGGGGAGDARINVRGFSQRNMAVMINGVPVNDMENGWVYWSNWDGLGDAATSIQLQRGLSAVNLATPSIGGTMNVITDPSAQRPSISYKQEVGLGFVNGENDWSFFRENANGETDQYANMLKETLVVNTGEHAGFALTGAFVRKTGSGVYQGFTGGDATWTDAWSYYLATSYQINSRHRLEAYAVGAPQRHGQNLYQLNIGTLNRGYAMSLEDYNPQAFGDFGRVGGRTGSPNVGPVSSSYTGQQYASTGPGSGTNDRHDPDYINERENYFHKPQINLNWYAYFGNGLSLTTVGYYSGGRGGGTGTYGSLLWDYTYTQRFADWDATVAANQALAAGGMGSRGILRNSVNNQDTWGAISKLRKDFSGGWTGEVGVDWRTATIDHYREVRDLLGGSYYDDCGFGCSSDFWTGTDGRRGLGDKIDYYNTNTVDWLGAYLQGERATTDGSIYGMVGWAQNSYTFEDFFTDDGTGRPLVLESGNLNGYQIKGGAVRNLTDQWSVFGNAGFVSGVPILDGVIDDENSVKIEDPKNEKFVSFEVGAQFRSMNRAVSFDVNLYHTTWRDRTLNVFVRDLLGTGDDGAVRLLGVDQRHFGVELEGAWQPSDIVRFDAAASIGDWKYTSDPSGQFISTATNTSFEYDFYLDGLKVADAPQQQMALTASFFPASGLTMSAVGKFYRKYYAEFDPSSRCVGDVADSGGCQTTYGSDGGDEVLQRNQSWQTPSYGLIDAHLSYALGDLLPVAGGADVRLFVNVYNVFNTLYVQDARDNSSFNGFDGDHDADDAEVYLGIPRNINLGFQVTF
jgi:iron complex outermembrane receptor protein